jgi:hypothetical protein
MLRWRYNVMQKYKFCFWHKKDEEEKCILNQDFCDEMIQIFAEYLYDDCTPAYYNFSALKT